MQLNKYMCLRTHNAYNAFPTAVPAILADFLLHCFFLGVGNDLEHIQHYVLVSVQSCDASKHMLQGEKQQKIYTRENFIAFCESLFSNPYSSFSISL